jgi:hypothetical protein
MPARSRWSDLKTGRLADLSAQDRDSHDATYAEPAETANSVNSSTIYAPRRD